MTPHPTHPKPPQELADQPDLVDRIFDYLVEILPELEAAEVRLSGARERVRREFAGIETYVRKRDAGSLRPEVLALFNGRNASEVARRLGVSRATVYRCLKQPAANESQFSEK
ncbi:helix-turn-helix domain-containing protein [Paucibacter sp. DJ1R-11]|uniref:helix-turn-helix domain-containing protein n=1 Tax=Paucibacter sp. DJ1R-11 TaxID=2893556 RepID=UPI0021E36576|nr:helix-turn-helix domain-containing protein [Paucibacter sp. DJ1R-11]MCV2365541.1 helix-turn-helix domain-containing protein [Paucibacter sp. DJ1R-11]